MSNVHDLLFLNILNTKDKTTNLGLNIMSNKILFKNLISEKYN